MKTNLFVFCCLLSQSSLIKPSDIPTLSISEDTTDDQTYLTLDDSNSENQSTNQMSNSFITPLQNQASRTTSLPALDATALNQNIASLETKIKYLQKNITHLQKTNKLRDPNIMEKIKQNQKIIRIYKDQIAAYQKQIAKLQPATPLTNSNRSLNLGRLSSKKRNRRS